MPGAGPVKVITDKGILESDPETGEMVLTALYPGRHGRRREEQRRLAAPARDHLDPIAPPGAEELRLLRDVLDPQKLYLG